MNIGRFFGGILSFMIIVIACCYKLQNTENFGASLAYVGNSGDVYNTPIEFSNTALNEEILDNMDVIKFTNTYNYPVVLNTESISVVCRGMGENKEEDEALVRNNIKINAKFSKYQNGSLMESINVSKGDTVYIYVSQNYVGDAFPTQEVVCDYNINIQAS